MPHWRKALFWKHYRRWKDGSVVLISGASGGIGSEIALRYAPRKARLVLAGRRVAELEALADRCRGLGSEALVVPTDVAEEEQCRALVEAAVRAYGGVDILVLAAGVSWQHEFGGGGEDVSAKYRRMMDVNFFGCLHCTRHAFPHLVRSGSGLVVVVSSVSGEVGLPYRTGYCASQFARTGLFEALRSELDAAGTRVDIVIAVPPAVRTGLRGSALTEPGLARRLDGDGGEGDAEADMSAADCAATVVDAADRRLRKVIFPLSTYVGVYARPFVPDLVDYFARKHRSRL